MAAIQPKRRRTKAAQVAVTNGRSDTGVVDAQDLRALVDALKSAKRGEFSVRLSTRKTGIVGELNRAFNELAEVREKTTRELVRVSHSIREGRLSDRAKAMLRHARIVD